MLRQRARGARWALVIVVGLLIAGMAAPAVLAQDYRFNLQENRSNLYINSDGTVQIVYDLTFYCDPGADPIDVVDVGMPNDSYDLNEVQAWIDGTPLSRISDSPYVKPGIAVELVGYAIQPGETGTLHVEATLRDLLYQDSKDGEYASIEFSPTWFDGDFVYGTTRQEVSFHFPLGVTAEEPRYHDAEFTTAGFEDDRVVYTWIKEDASGSGRYVYGASFPKSYLAEGVIRKAPAFNFNPGALCGSPFLWFLLFVVGWAVVAMFGARKQQQRKFKYLPPSVAVEGTGVKRGLTAVEAAILLEAPLNKVITMILFGLLKKGILTVESDKPLRVKALAQPPKDADLWYYERRFLQAILDDGSLKEAALREMIVDLIGDVNKKLAGFDRKETAAYYKDIIARAWKQVEAANTPEVLGERWGEGLEWTMLDDDWDDRTRRVFEDRPVVLPNWSWGYRPWATHSGAPSPVGSPSTSPSPAPSPAGGGRPVTLPTLPGADFANTVVTSIGNAANTVVSGIEGFTGKVTQQTNPPPKPSSSSSRSGGGGRSYSCACACACAGCACACAGGGR